MKAEFQNLGREAENALKQCLEKVPFVQIGDIQKEPEGGARIDFTVELTVYGMKQVLAVEVNGNRMLVAGDWMLDTGNLKLVTGCSVIGSEYWGP